MVRIQVLAAVAAAALLAAGPAAAADPGRLPQTRALPSTGAGFERRMLALWRAVVHDAPRLGTPAFFPRAAYRQAKAVADPDADYAGRLLTAFAADVRAAHAVVAAGRGRARFLRVVVPRQWAWIPPGACANRVGYWHAPGARLLYEQGGAIRSFGISSLISWRGSWYVVHLAPWDAPGTVIDPSAGAGRFGPAGGC